MSLFTLFVLFVIVVLIIYSIAKGISVQKRKVLGGDTGIIGHKGRCVKVYNEKEGKIFVNGEFWNAIFKEPVKENEKIIVVDVVENTPIVEKADEGEKNII